MSAPGGPARPPRRSPPGPPPWGGLRRVLHFLLVFVACVMILNAVAGEKGLLELLRTRREHAAAAAALAQLREENARLREEARRLREDPGLIEELARRELGLIRPGEMLFIVRDADRPAPLPR